MRMMMTVSKVDSRVAVDVDTLEMVTESLHRGLDALRYSEVQIVVRLRSSVGVSPLVLGTCTVGCTEGRSAGI